MSLNYVNKYRPHLHFAPGENWMNDPNGMVYFDGEYHLFFQHNPNDNVWGPMHWGHAVSKDLINWEELPIALYPDENGTIFSGSAVVDWNNTTGFFPEEPGLVAIFTHHKDGEGGQPPKQTQSLAYSHDKGRNWTKYQGNPVLGHESKIDFRDPKVFWHHNSNKWIMSLATGQTISFYSSSNLIDWEFESEFGKGIGSHDGVWECPDLFELKTENSEETKWVLFVSIGDNPEFDAGSRTQYFVGIFDGSTFEAEHTDVRWLDFGKDNYAGVSFSDIPKEDGRRIYLGWMSNWRYANEVPTNGWRSQMTLPRELTLKKVDDQYRVIQMPVEELNSYFMKEIEINNQWVSENQFYKVDEPYIELSLNLENSDATKYGMEIHHTDTNQTSITIDEKKRRLTLERENSGETAFSDNFQYKQELDLRDSQQIKLNLVVDSSSVELFGNDGEFALTSLIYPDKACQGISVFALEGSLKIKKGYISIPKL